MVIDFKDVSFSFKQKKKKKLLRRLKFGFIIIFLIFFYFIIKNFFELKKIENIQDLLIQNNVNEATKLFKEIEKSFFLKKTKKELKALIHFFNNDVLNAGEILGKIKGKKSNITFNKFLKYFSDNAEYKKLKVYTDYLEERGEDILFYKALYKSAFFNFKQSQDVLKQIKSEMSEEDKKAVKVIEKINKELNSGKINYIFDINGISLACYDLKKKKTISLTPGIVFEKFNPFFKKGIKFYKLTINSAIQNKIHKLFKDYYGSFLLFDLSDNSIIAAYSKPIKRDVSNSVFSQEYEPGSILKVLTLFSYLNANHKDLFPLNCRGNIELSAGSKNRVFYDWKKHNNVNNYLEAFTVSCNVSFAKMSKRVGLKNLSEIYNKFYFNSSDFKDRFITFGTGNFSNKISNDFQLANLSVGLDIITITTFHSALISSIIAQDGSICSPYLIKNIKSLLNLGFYNHKPEIINIFSNNTNFLKIKEAMIQVVDDKNGTGKRSKVNFVQCAVKTGTAGSRKLGFDAVLLGFFPARKARYAFAFRLERGGKAQLEGAIFLKNFLISLYDKTEKGKS